MSYSNGKLSFSNPANEGGQFCDDLEKNIRMLEAHFCQTEDLMKKELLFNNQKCVVLYLDAMVKKELLQSSIIEPILEGQNDDIENTIHAAEIKTTSMILEVGKQLLDGNCVILLENNPQAYLASVGGIEVTNTLLEANCDALGIGRRISSFHPEIWKKINWVEEYKNVQFEPAVNVNIIKTGNVF